MIPDASFILKKTKQLLSQRSGQFAINLIIHLLECSHCTEYKTLKLKAKSLSRASKSDVQELISIEDFGISFTRLDHSNPKCALYLFRCDTYACHVEIPMSFEKKGDVEMDAKIRVIWNYYVESIGADKNAWKKTPTLTTSANGRYRALKSFLKNNPDFDVEHAFLVIDGTLRSPHHMGFNPITGEKNPKHYCDIGNIFTNRQRAEELMAKSGSEHYLIQLEKLKNKNDKLKNIQSLKSQTTKQDLTVETDDEWLGL